MFDFLPRVSGGNAKVCPFLSKLLSFLTFRSAGNVAGSAGTKFGVKSAPAVTEIEFGWLSFCGHLSIFDKTSDRSGLTCCCQGKVGGSTVSSQEARCTGGGAGCVRGVAERGGPPTHHRTTKAKKMGGHFLAPIIVNQLMRNEQG